MLFDNQNALLPGSCGSNKSTTHRSPLIATHWPQEKDGVSRAPGPIGPSLPAALPEPVGWELLDLCSRAHLGKESKPGISSFSSFLLLKQIFPCGYSQSTLWDGARLKRSRVSQEFVKPPSPVTSLGGVYSQTLLSFFKGHCFFRFARGP